MIFSRSWFALMRRNLIYRKRYLGSTIFEFLTPFCFVWIVVAIKNSVDVDSGQVLEAFLPQDVHTVIPFSYADYMQAIQALRVCSQQQQQQLYNYTYDSSDLDLIISGMETGGYNWQVPFVRCDARRCEYLGQDAHPFCEYSILAVSGSAANDEGGSRRAEEFRTYMYDRWPFLLNAREGTTVQEGRPFPFEFVQIFSDAQDMEAYLRRADYGSVGVPKIGMGVVFDGDDPNNFKYWLRQNSTLMNAPESESETLPVVQTTPSTNTLFNDFARNDLDTCRRQPGEPTYGDFQDSCTGQYFYNGVIATQRLVGDFILNQTGAEAAGVFVADGGVGYVPFPSKEYVDYGFFGQFGDILPLLFTLGLLFPAASMIGYIVREKEHNQKELMKIMSVTESDIGWAWFSSFFLFHLLSMTITAFISIVLFEDSDFLTLWLFWLLTILCVIVFTMTMAAFTSKTSRAVLIGILVFLMGVVLTIAVDFRTAEPAVVRFICLHPVTAFTYGINVIGRLEDIGIGVSFDSLDFTESNIRFSMKTTMRWMAFDSLLWGCLAYYLNRVIPQDYGQHLPLWFPLLPSYWFPSLRHAKIEKIDATREANSSGALVEEVGSALKKQTKQGQTIEIVHLRKIYGEKVAIDDLSMTMYSGQITALLGHNGAGKTTTINVLTGVTAPTSGQASIVGKDIHSDVSAIRQDIGICFQHDCLFDKLTVREHIEFFARLKGLYARVSRTEADRQIDQAILDVALSEKRSTLSCNLSGGMKRKLSVAIAFCGGSKVVLLDEPTSGMDPFSRRFTWDVIRSYRQDRIIILTTHFMDEADILGDRIAIMAEGQLRCAGSSLWLKKQYSVGYQLTIERSGSKLPRTNEANDIVIDSDSTSDGASDVHENAEVKQIVTEAIPHAKVIMDVGAELSYQLPIGESSKFPSLFERLDKQIERGKVSSYGISITTLNAVFLAVTKGARATIMSQRDMDRASSSQRESSLRLDLSQKAIVDLATQEDTATTIPDSWESRKVQNFDIGSHFDVGSRTKVAKEAGIDYETNSLFCRHLRSLLKKRALFFRRDKKAWICTTIVPSVFVLIGLVIFVSFAASRNLSPLELDIQDYNAVLGTTIPFNTPDSPFRCQTGFCSYPQPYVMDQLTGELYVWCGFESRIGITRNSQGGYNYELSDDTCYTSHSRNIINSVASDYISTEEAGVRSISEASLYLDYFRDSYANSKYGAIWFTHDETSKINGGALYNDTVIFQCELIRPSLTYSRDCRKFGGVGYVIQYNFTSLHAALMYEAIANEALVRFATGSPDFKVQMTIAPLPVTSLENGIGAGEDAFTVWFLIVFGFPFIAGAYASFVVTERKIGAKHLQTVAGVGTCAYWFSTFLWDIFNYQIPLWVTIGLMYLFKVDVLTTEIRDTFSGVITLLFLFGPASAGFAYCGSFAFKSASMANICMIIIGFLIGMGGPLVCIILVLVARDPTNPRPQLEAISGVLEWMLRFVPSFCLGNGLYTVINIDFFLFIEDDNSLTAWSGPIMAYDIYFLAAECILYPLLAIQFDLWSTNPHVMSVLHRFFHCTTCKSTSVDTQTVSLPDDDDVIEEEKAVLSADETEREKLITIKSLTKKYDSGKLAVDRLSLGIAPGECFGLLGINGAGKTTTMKMLTAEFAPTSGDAILDGFSVSREPQKTRRKIGYCPQFDAHFAHLTGREHVELYASIKGIPVDLVTEIADEKLREMGLSTLDSNRLAVGYSGGMKRRLSLACATVGQPQIIFLDECSTGVDPVARADIWMMVSDIVAGRGLPASKKPSVILTTHSMEECEALCPRIGIMANGRLRCLGSAQRLKSKFGQGFQVEMKVKFVDCDDEDFADSAVCLKGYEEGESKELFNLQECKDALYHLTGTSVLSDMVLEDSGSPGYSMWKEASSLVGVSLEELTLFATTELRMLKLESFISENFPEYVLRERQDTKARYEVSGSDVCISRIFASIEENKDELRLSDYSASQTSLEQVFNMHAAEAERHKQLSGE